jgi:hypothetical protein
MEQFDVMNEHLARLQNDIDDCFSVNIYCQFPIATGAEPPDRKASA